MTNFEKLTEHTSVDITTQMTSRSCTLGAISLDKYSIAIDTGNPLDLGIKVRKDLEEHIKLPVGYLFLTHAHSDHRGGMGAFKDTKLLLSMKCKENMPKNVRFSGWTVETFDDKFILQEKDITVEFYHMGGHSLGSSVAYVPDEGVLFAGDLFFEETINLGLPFLGIYQFSPRKTGNPEECLTAFKRFKSMKLDYIVPGHGIVIDNPQVYLDGQISFFKSLKEFMISEIKEGKSIEEIELPRIGQIERAYQIIETKSQKYKALKFMDTMLNWIKKSFYNFYKEN
jgi:glyoxylase-like metal-dependent hydrolase (beta-lactamase superfamily II)